MEIEKKNRLNKILSLLEELFWLFESRKNLDLKESIMELRDSLSLLEGEGKLGNQYKSSNPNLHFLIGILPRLFQDKKLFLNNQRIISFAKEVLKIDVSSRAKRSRHEIIGRIVCETDSLSDKALDGLVFTLSEITKSEVKLKKMREACTDINFSWNETLQRLSE